jgi:hypothetical protein
VGRRGASTDARMAVGSDSIYTSPASTLPKLSVVILTAVFTKVEPALRGWIAEGQGATPMRRQSGARYLRIPLRLAGVSPAI